MLKKLTKFIQRHRSTIITIVILTVISLLLNFLVSDPSLWGRELPDTNSYILLGEAFAKGTIIKSSRTPGYPLLIALFNFFDIQYKYISPFQLILNAFSPALVFLILKQLNIKYFFILLASVLVMIDYHIINYSNTLLTEGLAVPQLLLFLLLVLLWVKDLRNIKLLILNVLAGVLLFYTRPIHYLLPISMYAIILLYAMLKFKIKNNIQVFKNIFIAIIATGSAILFWTLVTYGSSGILTFSSITVRSKLGVYLKSGYIKNYELHDGLPDYVEALIIEQQTNPHGSPHKLLFALEDQGYKLTDKETGIVDRYLIEENQVDNIFRSIRRGFSMLLNIERMWRGGEPRYEFIEDIVNKLDYYLFVPITSLSIVSLLGGSAYLFSQITMKKKNWYQICIFSIFLWTIVYTIGVIGFAGYSDFGRLKIPIEPLLIMLFAMCLDWGLGIVKDLFILLKNKTKPLITK